MAAEGVDRRTARTRGAVTAAFVDLLLERGYAQVTVSDVVERANVGRSTFNAHCTGLDALLRQLLVNPSARSEARKRALRLPLVALQLAEGQIALTANWLSLRAGTPPEAVAQALVDVTKAQLVALAGAAVGGEG